MLQLKQQCGAWVSSTLIQVTAQNKHEWTSEDKVQLTEMYHVYVIAQSAFQPQKDADKTACEQSAFMAVARVE